LGLPQYSPPYAPPAVPDVYGCDPRYFMANDTANMKDCEQAFGLLPEGPNLVEWAINGDRMHKNNPHQLPYNSTFGQCPIDVFLWSNPFVKGMLKLVRYLSNRTLRFWPVSDRA